MRISSLKTINSNLIKGNTMMPRIIVHSSVVMVIAALASECVADETDGKDLDTKRILEYALDLEQLVN